MAGHDTESQFKFLVSCIKHSTAGKVDFGKVAQELDIVSKGAAAKRYERLMKAHGGPNPTSPTRSGSAKPQSTPRRGKHPRAEPAEDDDEEDEIKLELKKKIKREMDSKAPSESACMHNLNEVPLTAAVSTLGAAPDDPSASMNNNGEDDEIYLICSMEKKEALAGPPVECHHQGHVNMGLLPGVDHAHIRHCSQPAFAEAGVTSYPYTADISSQPTPNSVHPNGITPLLTGSTWYHPHESSFLWSNMSRANMDHDVDRT